MAEVCFRSEPATEAALEARAVHTALAAVRLHKVPSTDAALWALCVLSERRPQLRRTVLLSAEAPQLCHAAGRAALSSEHALMRLLLPEP